ncbi:hypothetical protein Q7P37_005260 [Cladosporium fusiforme]
MKNKRALTALPLFLIYGLAHAQSTTVVSLTSTTTVHASETDDANACNNFNGACVVYGDNEANGAPYTTTVYRDVTPTPTEIVTSTTIIQETTTASDASACENFNGACVVYAGNGEAAYTTTAAGYQGDQGVGQKSPGNSDGYIGEKKGDSAVVIGTAASLASWTWVGVLSCAGTFAAALLA